MVRSPATGTASREPAVRLHLAARIEDALHGIRERAGRRRGLVPTVIPFTGYGATGWVRVLGRVILLKPGVPRADRFTNIRGWRSFFTIPVRDLEVTVRAGDELRTLRTDRGGVMDAGVDIDLAPGWQTVELSIGEGDRISSPVFIVDSAVGFGVLSDIDDTVMVTALPRPFLAAWNSFVLSEHARTPVAGMAVLYDHLARAHPGSPVIYLSTGAWNVAPALTRFLSRNLYPQGALLLTDWGPTHDRWFRNGPEHKRSNLERLAREFPGIRWLLIGDDGQRDEQIYGDFADQHPQNIAAIAIRQLTPGEAVLAGGRSAAENKHRATGVRWIYAPDGAGLSEQLIDLGLL